MSLMTVAGLGIDWTGNTLVPSLDTYHGRSLDVPARRLWNHAVGDAGDCQRFEVVRV